MPGTVLGTGDGCISEQANQGSWHIIQEMSWEYVVVPTWYSVNSQSILFQLCHSAPLQAVTLSLTSHWTPFLPYSFGRIPKCWFHEGACCSPFDIYHQAHREYSVSAKYIYEWIYIYAFIGFLLPPSPRPSLSGSDFWACCPLSPLHFHSGLFIYF